VTERGRKHLNELVEVAKEGHRAAMLFVVLRSDGTPFRAAHEIDPRYAAALDTAIEAGVEIHAWRADVSPQEIQLASPVATQPA
jgi:sugar fermentation stimulation protein A